MQLLDRFELAKILKVHPLTITNWRRQGMPFLKPSTNVVRFELDKVREWVIERTREITCEDSLHGFFQGK